MKRIMTILIYLVLAGSSVLPGLVQANKAEINEPAIHAFDIMKLFIQDPNDVNALFKGSFTSNMRMPPKYLGVKFYDERSQQEIDRQEIREELGAVRQDGAYALIEMVMRHLPASYGLTEQTLEDLVDAAFIASMRQPPKHISIEFYDTRVGPTGKGGGASGRTPVEIYQPEPTAKAEPDAHLDEQDISPIDDSFEGLKAKYESLNLELKHPENQIALPVYAYGKSEQALKTNLLFTLENMANVLDLEFVDYGKRVFEQNGDYQVIYSVGYFKGDKEVLEEIKGELW